MATTTTVVAVNQLKGPHQGGDLHALEVCVKVTGSYATAAKPNFNILSDALQTFARTPASAVAVKQTGAFQDGNDCSNVYTAPNAQQVGSTVNAGCTNDKLTFRIDSGATDGATGTEIADSTVLNHYFTFLVLVAITGL